MKWLKRGAVILGGAVLLLALVPFLVSLNDYIPQIESELSARIKEPVRIKNIRLVGLPLPHVTVDGIAVGETGDITVGTVTVTPDLLSLLGSTKVIRSIEIDKLVLTRKAIDRISALTKGTGKGEEPVQVTVRVIRLDGALIKLDHASFGPFDARLKLTGAGDVEDITVTTRDGKLEALVRPAGKASLRIDAQAKSWKLPAGPAILFDELSVKGVATPGNVVFDSVRARLYGGSVSGRASVAWEKGMQLRGDLEVSDVELKPLVPLLAPGAGMSGKLSAKPVFSANARDASQLAEAVRLETPFNVRNGVLYGVDIGKAATALVGGESGKGGETHFDTLSGILTMERGSYHLTQLRVASGSLAADGNVTISPRDELSGRINASLKAAKLASATVPLNVSGTVQHPLLLPTRGTFAGAAAGTVILGPGLGTSVGAKMGQWTEGLFGKKEEKK